MSVKFLFLALCCIALIFAEKEAGQTKSPKSDTKSQTNVGDSASTTDTPKEETCSSKQCDAPNYDAVIEAMQGQINKMDVDASKSGAEITAAKIELGKIKEKLDDVEVKASDINTVQQFLNSLTDSVSTLSAKIEKLESDQSKKQEATPQTAASSEDIDAKIEAASEAIAREVDDNSRRLDFLSEIIDEKADFADIKEAIEDLSKEVDTSSRRIDGILENQWEAKILRNVTKRIEKIEAAIYQHTKDLKTVYQSTLVAKLDVAVKNGLDFLDYVGKYCTDLGKKALDELQSIDYKGHYEAIRDQVIAYATKAVEEFQKIDWKGYAEIAQAKVFGAYETITDPKQQQKVLDFFKNTYNYIKFWTQEAIQPAIVSQATNLYVGAQEAVKTVVDYVHSHVLYRELTKQSKVYIEMAGAPVEYTQHIIDGVLVVFALSSLLTLSFLLGMLCDCCCPRKPAKVLDGDNAKNSKATQKNKNQRQRRKSNMT